MVGLVLLLLAATPLPQGCSAGSPDLARALAEEVLALPVSPLPNDFDRERAAAGVVRVLAEQGETVLPGVTELVITDADHTAVKTITPVLFRNRAGELLTDPATGEILMVRRRGAPEGAALLRELHPEIDWSQWTMSWEEWDSLEGILSQEGIPATLAKLQAASRRPNTRVMVITARPAPRNGVVGFRGWFRRQGINLAGVFGVATPSLARALGVDKAGYDDALRKTLIIAAAIRAYGPSVRKLTFYEDNDSNLALAMAVLPRVHPGIAFRFVRVVHQGEGLFSLRLAGRSPAGTSAVLGAGGRPLSEEEIRGFRVADPPFDPSHTAAR